MKVNTNQHCLVSLTYVGVRLLQAHWGDQFETLRKTEQQADGRWRLPLWELMNVVGPACVHGGVQPIEGNEIEIEG